MARISYDGQSFILDDRRLWLVSGAIHYARVAPQLWRRRIRAARLAGLNCIETQVFWNLHEPSPGTFNFEGAADLGRFVRLIGEEGLYCMLRAGPYVGDDWDSGGLPPWLAEVAQMRLRQVNGPFLEACARYLGAVMGQVASLQVTSPIRGKKSRGAVGGGPIIMMQAEYQWLCDNPKQEYVGEIARYLRESGCRVPIIECNNLWSAVDGTISTWKADNHLTADLRQMRLIQPQSPRLVSEHRPGVPDHWGEDPDSRVAPELFEYRLGSILAAASQFNMHLFHGGTNFGFFGGRAHGLGGGFVTTSHDCDAPLREAGGQGPKYLAVKRLCTFANQFGHLFANFDPDRQSAVVLPVEEGQTQSIIHQSGLQGQVVFVLKGAGDRSTETTVLLPGGEALSIPTGSDRVAWFVLNMPFSPGLVLTHTNLRPWAILNRRLLVLFGPAGADGVVCINDASHRIKVPNGQTPAVLKADELVVVVLNRKQVDAAFLDRNELVIGGCPLGEDGQLIASPGWKSALAFSADGRRRKLRTVIAARPTAPRLGPWQHAGLEPILNGNSPTFRVIDDPAPLEQLGCPFGYGWYRLKMKAGRTQKTLAPRAADRLHLYQEGSLKGILGHGFDGMDGPISLNLAGTTVVLADNLGRVDGGWNQQQPAGLFGHFYAARSVKLGRPKVSEARVPDLFELDGFWNECRRDERPRTPWLSWNLNPDGRNPLIVDVAELPFRAALLVNGALVGAVDPHQSSARTRFVLEVGVTIRMRPKRLQLALFEPVSFKQLARIAGHLRLYQATENLTSRAGWAFAPWTMPEDADFSPMERPWPGRPCWYRSRFTVSGNTVPLFLEVKGLSKGQIYINGHNAGRYFVSTRTGKAVGPQSRYYLPEPWLDPDADNELTLFEEHGKSPTSCRLVNG